MFVPYIENAATASIRVNGNMSHREILLLLLLRGGLVLVNYLTVLGSNSIIASHRPMQWLFVEDTINESQITSIGAGCGGMCGGAEAEGGGAP